MRIGARAIVAGIAMASFLLIPSRAKAQDETMMPEQSAAKAKQVIQTSIEGQGGAAYLNARDMTCTAQVSQFDHGGNLNGYQKEIEYIIFPDKERDENLPKRNIISVNNGNKGWSLDRGGVSDMDPAQIADYQNQVNVDLGHIFRDRIKEDGMVFRYGGSDIVDLKPVDWVILTDKNNQSIRIAITQATHLPVQEVVEASDPSTHLRADQTYIFSNYHPIAGIQTAFQITHDRNGFKASQVFLKQCDYNTGVSPSLFTKQSLQDRWDKVGKKQKKKK